MCTTLLALACLLAAPARPVRAQPAASIPAFDHVFIIVMENKAEAEIIGNTAQAPYLNQLASQYGVASAYRAVTHPSLPNYLALTGGDTFGVTSDCTACFVSAPNFVADRVVPSGRTWKTYQESMPAPCFLGDRYPYAQRHNPFVYYDDIRTTSQCANVVPFDELAGDLADADSTPNYVWITPNLCNDIHDCAISVGDTWLAHTVGMLLNAPAFTSQQSLLLITWDEDDASQHNQVASLVIAPGVVPGFRSTTPYTHYSVLRTIEEAWGLEPLGPKDAAASPMSDFFVPSDLAEPDAQPDAL